MLSKIIFCETPPSPLIDGVFYERPQETQITDSVIIDAAAVNVLLVTNVRVCYIIHIIDML